MTSQSPPLTLPATGSYSFAVYNAPGAYGFRIDVTSVVDIQPNAAITQPTIASGQFQLFRVVIDDLPLLDATDAGRWVFQVRLHDPGFLNRNEIFVGFNSLPTRRDTKEQSTFIRTPGTWYFLVRNSFVASPGSYTFEVQDRDVVVNSISPTRIDGNKENYLWLDGLYRRKVGEIVSNYDVTSVGPARVRYYDHWGVPFRQIAIEFIDSFGQLVPGVSLTPPTLNILNSDFTFRPTVALSANTLSAGIYSIRISDDTGYSQTLPGVLTVVNGGLPKLVTSLSVPNPIGFHIATQLTLTYSNAGDVPMAAPLLTVTGTQNGIPGALLTLDSSKVTSGFWTSANPDGYNQSVQILASGKTPGLLRTYPKSRLAILRVFERCD